MTAIAVRRGQTSASTAISASTAPLEIDASGPKAPPDQNGSPGGARSRTDAEIRKPLIGAPQRNPWAKFHPR